MERSKSGGIVKLGSAKGHSFSNRQQLRSDEVMVDVGLLETHRNEGEAHAMLELSFDVQGDQVTLRTVNSEEELWERTDSSDRRRRKAAGATPSSRSGSYRESIKAMGNLVQQFSSSIARGSRNGRVQAELAPTVDPELGLNQMQKSPSIAEHAIKTLRMISKATATDDQKKSWKKVEERFESLAEPDGMLPRSNFAECIGMKDSKEFAMELYDAAVRRKGREHATSISKEELYEYWLLITDKGFDAKMRVFFDLCDKDSDGRITGEEVKQVIMLSASANKLSKLKEQASEYAALIMEELDTEGNGYIELSQLETLMNATSQKAEAAVQYTQLLKPPTKAPRKWQKWMQNAGYFWLDNWKRLWIIALWVLAMAGLFTWKFLQYKERDAFEIMGYCLCVAKGAAETVKLNMALILLPVCRNTLTRLRSTRLGKIIPFDNNLDFHKTVAAAIAVGVFVHATCHITCDIPKFVYADDEKFEEVFKHEFSHQPSYAEIVAMPVGWTGIVMTVLMIIAMLLATHWFRRSLVKLPWPLHRLHGFNVFWYSHHLFVIVYALLMVHTTMLLLHNPWYERTTWMYVAVPLVLYISERLVRLWRTNSIPVEVARVGVYPGDVLAIHITKPESFKYKSGMYMFLQCPTISGFEWHPFSITSAPNDPFLSVHIRTLGDWTKELRRIFSEANGGRERLQTVNNYNLSGELTLAARYPKLYIDGPYGAPAQDYLKYDVLLLVGLGIGATPFISILKDMLHHARDDSVTHHGDDDCSPSRTPKKKAPRSPKAYFYWVTREQGSFDWFRGIMREVEEIDDKERIQMHNYLTSVYEEGDARSTLVMMLQALHHAKNGVDVVSGTRARTHFARPNWKNVFSSLAATHQDKRIGVFYCGPVALAKQLEELSRTYTMKSSTKFSFHKENF